MKTYMGSLKTIALYDDHLVIEESHLIGRNKPREIPLAAIENVVIEPATALQKGQLWPQLSDQLGPPQKLADPNRADFAELAEVLQQRISENRAAGINPVSIPGVSFEGVTLWPHRLAPGWRACRRSEDRNHRKPDGREHRRQN
jgi:hypothetical protein